MMSDINCLNEGQVDGCEVLCYALASWPLGRVQLIVPGRSYTVSLQYFTFRGRVSGLEIRGSNGSKCYHVFSFATGVLCKHLLLP